MADHTEEALFREIDEEIKQDRLIKLWKNYGKYFVGIAICLVTSIIGYQGWSTWDQSSRAKLGAMYDKAQEVAINEPLNAAKLFKQLAEDGSPGYTLLAQFQVAANLALGGKPAEAINMYDSIVEKKNIDNVYRDLARLLSVVYAIEHSYGSSKEITIKLSPLLENNNPWRYSAKELSAFLLQKEGDTEKARALYQSLILNPQTPTGIRQRSEKIILNLSK